MRCGRIMRYRRWWRRSQSLESSPSPHPAPEPEPEPGRVPAAVGVVDLAGAHRCRGYPSDRAAAAAQVRRKLPQSSSTFWFADLCTYCDVQWAVLERLALAASGSHVAPPSLAAPAAALAPTDTTPRHRTRKCCWRSTRASSLVRPLTQSKTCLRHAATGSV